jgi:hypothetical protein
MTINPCPNPKCICDVGTKVDPCLEFRHVECGFCGLAGPDGRDDEAAIAAWNSISMGWISMMDRPMPRDETFLAITLDDIVCGARWVDNAIIDLTRGVEIQPRWYMPIPPTPEEK